MFTVDYFIKKFEAIPEELWCVGTIDNGRGQHCALGHTAYFGDEWNELRFLFAKIDSMVSSINNRPSPLYPQPTPKQRILAALYDIKKMGDAKTPAITPAPPRIVYVTIDAEVKKLKEDIVMS